MALPVLKLDVLNYITEYLCFVDAMACRLVCRFWGSIKKPDIVALVKRRLLSALSSKEAVDQFCEAVYNTGAVMSGSFLLDCLYGTSCHKDIDVYDQGDPRETTGIGLPPGEIGTYDKFVAYLRSNGFVELPRQMLDGMVRDFIHVSKCPGADPNITQDTAARLGSSEDKIQIIRSGIKPSTPGKSTVNKCILASYDLDICKVGFDGQNLYVRSWWKMIYRFDHMIPNNILMESLYPDDSEFTAHRMVVRTEKYRQRNFHILHHPLHDDILMEIRKLRHKSCSFCEYGVLPHCPIYHKVNGLRDIQEGRVDLDRYSTSRWPRKILVKTGRVLRQWRDSAIYYIEAHLSLENVGLLRHPEGFSYQDLMLPSSVFGEKDAKAQEKCENRIVDDWRSNPETYRCFLASTVQYGLPCQITISNVSNANREELLVFLHLAKEKYLHWLDLLKRLSTFP